MPNEKEPQEGKPKGQREEQEHTHEHGEEHEHFHEHAEDGMPADTLPPPPDFGLHCQSLQMQAWIHMGKIPDPSTGETKRNLTWARFFIDMLGMLQTKTKGNLTPDEQRYLDMTLTTLRLTFVEEQKTPD